MKICNKIIFQFMVLEFEFQVILRSAFLHFHFWLLISIRGIKMED